MDMNYMIQRKKEFRNPRCVSHEPAGLVESMMLDQRCPMDVARRDPARIPPEPKGPSASLLSQRDIYHFRSRLNINRRVEGEPRGQA